MWDVLVNGTTVLRGVSEDAARERCEAVVRRRASVDDPVVGYCNPTTGKAVLCTYEPYGFGRRLEWTAC